MMKVYFDNAATTSLHPKVFEKMKPYLTEYFGNPSSIHSFGRKTRAAIEEARELIADFINAKPGEIYFTSGGTEANNFIIFGISKTEFYETGRNRVITSKVEHHSVLDSCLELTKYDLEVYLLDVNNQTKIEINKLEQSISKQTSLISLIHVNNETGSINPIKEIGALAKSKNIIFHTDAVQSFGKVKIDVNELNIDALTASAHKINGPKGIGFAYVRSGTPISSLLFGGSQERNRRGGTENVAGIIGFAEAVKIAKENMLSNYSYVKNLKEKFIEGIKNIDKDFIKINGGEDSSPYILSITLSSEKYQNDTEAMIMFLDINGVAVSSGSACTSGTLKPSHVIINSGYSPEDASGTIRFSFSAQNTIEEVYFALDIIKKLTEKFRK